MIQVVSFFLDSLLQVSERVLLVTRDRREPCQHDELERVFVDYPVWDIYVVDQGKRDIHIREMYGPNHV